MIVDSTQNKSDQLVIDKAIINETVLPFNLNSPYRKLLNSIIHQSFISLSHPSNLSELIIGDHVSSSKKNRNLTLDSRSNKQSKRKVNNTTKNNQDLDSVLLNRRKRRMTTTRKSYSEIKSSRTFTISNSSEKTDDVFNRADVNSGDEDSTLWFPRTPNKNQCNECGSAHTPQWRYIHKYRFCNACYMKARRRADNLLNCKLPPRCADDSPNSVDVLRLLHNLYRLDEEAIF